jgi:hypothetical protein
MKNIALYTITSFCLCVLLVLGCSKKDAPPPNPGGGNPPPTPTPKTCTLVGISQQNTGNKPDFALTVGLNANGAANGYIVFDSLGNIKREDVTFNYITSDSIRIDNHQYIRLDAEKRVVRFVTKSDLRNPSTADDYRYEYTYSNGLLATKKLYINDYATAYFTSTYTYTNNLLTKCVVTINEGTQKILESELTYDANTTIKDWIYTIPDAFESFFISNALSFGARPNRPLSQAITKLYNPSTNAVIDTWTTNYNGYSLNSDGYLIAGTANGDLQQGMATFYGKTVFYYNCK